MTNPHLIPIVVLATVDPVLRSSASFAALTDMPDTVVITQDIDGERDTPIHRLVSTPRACCSTNGWIWTTPASAAPCARTPSRSLSA